MKVNFICGKIDLGNLCGADALVCPTDGLFSGIGKLERAIRDAAGPGLAGELAKAETQNGGVKITGGHALRVRNILHLPVPHVSKARQEPDCLRKAYRTVLAIAGHKECRHMVISLLGAGGAGWSFEDSMEALWQEILDWHRSCGSRYFGESSLEQLDIYHPQDAFQTVYPYKRRASQAFFTAPDQWGTRGDPHMWYGMMRYFDDPKFEGIHPRDFIAEIQRYFHSKTGQWLCGDTQVFVREFANGGMSSGMISSFYAHIGIPLLVNNWIALDRYEHSAVSFLIPVELRSQHQKNYSLQLPYELLPLLTHLRSDSLHMNEEIRYSLDFQNLYYVTIHHHKYFPDLIDHYSLDVEDSRDRHYAFSEEAAQALVRHLHEHPKALIRGLKDYLKSHGGPALEKLVSSVSSGTFSY